MPDDLREQVKNALLNHGHKPENELLDDLADAVLAVFAEYKQSLRERIEALGFSHGQLLACYITGELATKVGERPGECPTHGGDACLFVFAAVTDVLGVFND